MDRAADLEHGEGAATVEVRVFRHGALAERVLCESEDQAALVIEHWSELDGVRCEVDDLTFRHVPGDVLEPEPSYSATTVSAEPKVRNS
jgi:hypothetical protein